MLVLHCSLYWLPDHLSDVKALFSFSTLVLSRSLGILEVLDLRSLEIQQLKTRLRSCGGSITTVNMNKLAVSSTVTVSPSERGDFVKTLGTKKIVKQ